MSRREMHALTRAGLGLAACVLAFLAFTAARATGNCSNPYGCANTTSPTGSQSRQPGDPPCSNPYGCGRTTGRTGTQSPYGPPGPGSSSGSMSSLGGEGTCIPFPPAATYVRDAQDLARIVQSNYGVYQGRSYPIFMAQYANEPTDWLVAIAGVDDQAAARGEVNNWATALRFLGAVQLAVDDSYAKSVVRAMNSVDMKTSSYALVVGHSLGGMTAQNLAFYAATLQLAAWPRTRFVTFGSPIVNFEWFGQRSPVSRYPGVSIRYFVASFDPAVNQAETLAPRRFVHAQIPSPPTLNIVQAVGGDPHNSYHITPTLLDYDAFGDPAGGRAVQLGPTQYRCTTKDGPAPAYQFGQPGPHAGACALVSLADLEKEVTDLRTSSALNSKQRTSGNIAVANIDIPGAPCFIAAHSAIQQPTPAQSAAGLVGLLPEASQRFRTTRISAALIPPWMQREAQVDTESKILEAVAQQLGNNAGVRGNMQLYTERPPCSSCSGVISQFGLAYPHISLMVLDGNAFTGPPCTGVLCGGSAASGGQSP